MKISSRRCRGCGVFFIPETTGQRVCGECRELIALGGTNDILEFERLREKFNSAHAVSKTYGQFEEYIGNIEKRVKK